MSKYDTKQNLNDFATGVVFRCKNGHRSLYYSTNEKLFRDVPADGFTDKKLQTNKDFELVGVYSSSIKPDVLASDLKYLKGL